MRDIDLHEYLLEGERVDGIGLAALTHQLALSFPSGQDWEDEYLSVEHQWIDEAAGEVQTETVRVLHAATVDHVQSRVDEIREMTLPDPFVGRDLWDQRKELFPGLHFLSRVRGDFDAFLSGDTRLASVFSRLKELDAACRAWATAGTQAPEWKSRVTPESDSRLDKCRFRNEIGELESFGLHARYTPGHGRIHLRLNSPSDGPHATIAYIGPKLG